MKARLFFITYFTVCLYLYIKDEVQKPSDFSLWYRFCFAIKEITYDPPKQEYKPFDERYDPELMAIRDSIAKAEQRTDTVHVIVTYQPARFNQQYFQNTYSEHPIFDLLYKP